MSTESNMVCESWCFCFTGNRNVPGVIWSYLHPNVCQDHLVDRCLLPQIISALYNPLKSLQTGFHFYVSILHLKTTLILVYFTKEKQCEKKNILNLFIITSFIEVFCISCCHYMFLWFNHFSASSPGPSFQTPVLSAPVPVSLYVQGSPIILKNGQYFSIPQVSFMFDVIFLFYFS